MSDHSEELSTAAPRAGRVDEPPAPPRNAPAPPPRRRVAWWIVFCFLALPLTLALSAGLRAQRADPPARGVLPGEFEWHDVLLLGWRKHMQSEQYEELCAIAAAAGRSMTLLVLTPDQIGREHARRMLEAHQVDPSRIDFLTAPVDTPWIRDYGPLQVKAYDGSYVLVDTTSEVPAKAQEDTPQRVASHLRLGTVRAPLILDGGNLLSNGAGLCLTTTYTLDQNAEEHGLSPRRVESLIREYFGADEVVFLEPLQGEPTGHVDMFTTFVGPDTVIVGRYETSHDPVNARILDANAERLARCVTASGPLRVERIVMPPRSDERWLTYTNVIHANERLLVPHYPEMPETIERQVRETYRRLLPGREIVPVSATALMRYEGGLHCATAQLFRLAEPSSPK